MKQQTVQRTVFLALVALLASGCFWSGPGTQIPPGYEYPDQTVYHDPTPTATDDPLHHPVMQPTAQGVFTPGPAQTDAVFQLPPPESGIQSRSIAGNGIRCDVNNDGVCNSVDSLIVFADRQSTARAPKPSPAARPSSTPRATATQAASPTARPSATLRPPTATLAPLPSATMTPAPPLVPTTPNVGSVITWTVTPFNFGDTPERFNVVFGAVKAAVATRPDLPLCNEADPAIHPPTKWHSLVFFTIAGDRITPICHYSHQHGQDPNQLNSIFGEPGAFLGVPGQSISGPHQTFNIPATVNDITITADQLRAQGVNVLLENEAKHTGYRTFAQSGTQCNDDNPNSEFYRRMCITDFRGQVHVHNSLDFHVRFHSFTFEARVCAWVDDQSTCGIRRLAGWAEHNRLFTPPEGTSCFKGFNAQPIAGLIDLPLDNQFYPPPFVTDERPYDEFRCHWKLRLSTVMANLNGTPPIRETMPFEWWFITGGDTRLQFMINNPATGPDEKGLALKPYCQQLKEANPHLAAMCRWTGSKLFVNPGYILAVRDFGTYYFLDGKQINAADDLNGDGVLDAKRWANRFGEFRTDTFCNGKAPSLDCLPDTWEGNMVVPHPLRRNPDGTPYINPATGRRESLPKGYLQGVKDVRPTGPGNYVVPFDGDITPAGVESWIADAWQAPARAFGPVLPDVQEVVDHADHGN